jgi:hypothetical protein
VDATLCTQQCRFISGFFPGVLLALGK